MCVDMYECNLYNYTAHACTCVWRVAYIPSDTAKPPSSYWLNMMEESPQQILSSAPPPLRQSSFTDLQEYYLQVQSQ